MLVTERVELLKKGRKGRYVARFRANGMITTKSLRAANLEVARKRARVIDGQFACGTYGRAGPSQEAADDVPVKQYLHAKHHAEKRRPKTIGKYADTLDAFEAWCPMPATRREPSRFALSSPICPLARLAMMILWWSIA